MKYDNWIRKVGEHSERSRANAERNQEYAENQRQLDDASGIVSRLSETEIEQKTEHIQSSFDCELECIRDEQRQIEAERSELRDGITKDMDILDQTIRMLEKLQENSKYGKQFLRTQLRCSRISMQLLRLLTELNYNESGLTNDGVAQLGRTYALVHTKVSMLCEAGMHIEAATDNENAKVLSMPLEEKRRRGENYVNEIVGIYRDNLVDQGAVAGAAMDKVMAELKLHYLAELEKELAGESSQLYTDPNYEQLMVRIDDEAHEEPRDIPDAEDGDISTDKIINDFVDQNVTTTILPKSNGHWSNPELPGEGMWIPDDEATFSCKKGGPLMTYGELKAKYGIEGIEYHNKEPNFEPFEDAIIGHVEIENFPDHRLGFDGTYRAAAEAVAQRLGWSIADVEKYMDENKLTWHECSDCKTIRAIPTEINAAFPHTGGVSIKSSVRAAAAALAERLEVKNLVLDRTDSYDGSVAKMDIKEIRDSIKRTNKSFK